MNRSGGGDSIENATKKEKTAATRHYDEEDDFEDLSSASSGAAEQEDDAGVLASTAVSGTTEATRIKKKEKEEASSQGKKEGAGSSAQIATGTGAARPLTGATTTTTGESDSSRRLSTADPEIERVLNEGVWRAAKDAATGKTYYFNTKTNQSTWDLREELRLPKMSGTPASGVDVGRSPSLSAATSGVSVGNIPTLFAVPSKHQAASDQKMDQGKKQSITPEGEESSHVVPPPQATEIAAGRGGGRDFENQEDMYNVSSSWFQDVNNNSTSEVLVHTTSAAERNSIEVGRQLPLSRGSAGDDVNSGSASTHGVGGAIGPAASAPAEEENADSEFSTASEHARKIREQLEKEQKVKQQQEMEALKRKSTEPPRQSATGKSSEAFRSFGTLSPAAALEPPSLPTMEPLSSNKTTKQQPQTSHQQQHETSHSPRNFGSMTLEYDAALDTNIPMKANQGQQPTASIKSSLPHVDTAMGTGSSAASKGQRQQPSPQQGILIAGEGEAIEGDTSSSAQQTAALLESLVRAYATLKTGMQPSTNSSAYPQQKRLAREYVLHDETMPRPQIHHHFTTSTRAGAEKKPSSVIEKEVRASSISQSSSLHTFLQSLYQNEGMLENEILEMVLSMFMKDEQRMMTGGNTRKVHCGRHPTVDVPVYRKAGVKIGLKKGDFSTRNEGEEEPAQRCPSARGPHHFFDPEHVSLEEPGELKNLVISTLDKYVLRHVRTGKLRVSRLILIDALSAVQEIIREDVFWSPVTGEKIVMPATEGDTVFSGSARNSNNKDVAQDTRYTVIVQYNGPLQDRKLTEVCTRVMHCLPFESCSGSLSLPISQLDDVMLRNLSAPLGSNRDHPGEGDSKKILFRLECYVTRKKLWEVADALAFSLRQVEQIESQRSYDQMRLHAKQHSDVTGGSTDAYRNHATTAFDPLHLHYDPSSLGGIPNSSGASGDTEFFWETPLFSVIRPSVFNQQTEVIAETPADLRKKKLSQGNPSYRSSGGDSASFFGVPNDALELVAYHISKISTDVCQHLGPPAPFGYVSVEPEANNREGEENETEAEESQTRTHSGAPNPLVSLQQSMELASETFDELLHDPAIHDAIVRQTEKKVRELVNRRLGGASYSGGAKRNANAGMTRNEDTKTTNKRLPPRSPLDRATTPADEEQQNERGKGFVLDPATGKRSTSPALVSAAVDGMIGAGSSRRTTPQTTNVVPPLSSISMTAGNNNSNNKSNENRTLDRAKLVSETERRVDSMIERLKYEVGSS